jgi:uncharacterized membrane protein
MMKAALGVNSMLGLLAVGLKQKSLTPSGLAHALVLGVVLWGTLGWRGWLICVLYLVFGSIVTKVKMQEKEVSKVDVLIILDAKMH